MLEYRCIFSNLSSVYIKKERTTILQNRTKKSKGVSRTNNAKVIAKPTQNKVSQRLDVKRAYNMQPALIRKVEENWK